MAIELAYLFGTRSPEKGWAKAAPSRPLGGHVVQLGLGVVAGADKVERPLDDPSVASRASCSERLMWGPSS
jgi:hypothetical protein